MDSDIYAGGALISGAGFEIGVLANDTAWKFSGVGDLPTGSVAMLATIKLRAVGVVITSYAAVELAASLAAAEVPVAMLLPEQMPPNCGWDVINLARFIAEAEIPPRVVHRGALNVLKLLIRGKHLLPENGGPEWRNAVLFEAGRAFGGGAGLVWPRYVLDEANRVTCGMAASASHHLHAIPA
jgi:hypothetical protein